MRTAWFSGLSPRHRALLAGVAAAVLLAVIGGVTVGMLRAAVCWPG